MSYFARYQVCLVALCLVASGCFSFNFGKEDFSAVKTRLGSCAPSPCVEVDIAALPEIPHSVTGDARVAIEAEIKRVLYAPLDVDNMKPSRDALIAEIDARMREYDSVSDAEIDWSLTRTARVVFSDSKVTSFEISNTGYLGGAHGFKDRSLMTFDSKTGHRLTVSDLVEESSRPTLTRILEAEFRRARSIAAGQSLQDAGFFILPGQELPIGENFALSDKGLEIQYNPYEVAPYALGETRVNLPKEAIAPLVKASLGSVFATSAL